MTDTLRQLAFTIQALCTTHFVCIFLNVCNQSANFFHTACLVGCNSLTQLLHTELHVMEVRNSFTQLFRQVGQHRFKFTELQSYQIRRFRSYSIQRLWTRNKDAHTPVFLSVKIIGLSFCSLGKTQHLAVDIVFTGSFQFLADMSCYSFNVMLKHFYIRKDIMIDTLQNIIGSSLICGSYQIGLVDKSRC